MNMLKAWSAWALKWHSKRIARLARCSTEKTVLMVRYEALGDVIWASAVARAYKQKHPGAKIVFLTHRRHAAMMPLLEGIDHVLVTQLEMHTAVDCIRYAYDEVHILEQKQSGNPRHIFEDYTEGMGVLLEPANPRLKMKLKAAKSKRKMTIHMGPTWPVRSVHLSIVNDALRQFSETYDFDLLQVGRTQTEEQKQAIRLSCAQDKLNQEDLPTLIESIASSDLFLGVDSGPMHIAAAARVPIIGLFSSTLPQTRLPFDEKHFSIQSDVSCIGCHHEMNRKHWRDGCPNNLACQKAFDSKTILAALKAAISETIG